MNLPKTQQKWYQSTGGAIFLGIIIFLLVAGILFLGLVGYFLYSMKYGNATALLNKYANNQDKTTTQPLSTNDLIRDYSPVLGSADALITILAFEDFECPFCRESYPIMKKVRERYGSALRIVFKHTPIVNNHKEALLAHIGATCAQDQGKFWEYYDLLYTTQKLDKDSLLGYAEILSINNSKFQQCLDSSIHLGDIETDLKDAVQIGLQGTPTYIINGTKIEGVQSEEDWSNLILQELKLIKP